MKALGVWCPLLFVAAAAHAQEAFPGQSDLAAGVACYRDFDTECARMRLERALSTFAPEHDRYFIQHVRDSRWMLAMIFLAAEDLSRAEEEFRTLLLLDPKFKLPLGDHPPKVEYVFDQAKKSLRPKRPPVRQADLATPPQTASAGSPPTASLPPVKPVPAPPPAEVRQPPPAPRANRWEMAAAGRMVMLFGEDQDAVHSGPGAALSLSFAPLERLWLSLGLSYAHHSLILSAPALQTLAAHFEAVYLADLGTLSLRAGGGLGAMTMGMRDRYDTWGLLLQASLALCWPQDGPYALALSLVPSLVITGPARSFFLPLGLGAQARW